MDKLTEDEMRVLCDVMEWDTWLSRPPIAYWRVFETNSGVLDDLLYGSLKQFHRD